MAKKGGQPGNNNALKNKPWADALRLELEGNANAKKLRALARKLIKLAEDGNMQAMKELGDRLDGKPAQAIEGDLKGNITVVLSKEDADIL